jgi:hypothetical protein
MVRFLSVFQSLHSTGTEIPGQVNLFIDSGKYDVSRTLTGGVPGVLMHPRPKLNLALPHENSVHEIQFVPMTPGTRSPSFRR